MTQCYQHSFAPYTAG